MYYIYNYTILSILSTLAHLIYRKFPYAFLHKSRNIDTLQLTPLKDGSNQLSLFIDYRYTFITSIMHAHTHSSLSK